MNDNDSTCISVSIRSNNMGGVETLESLIDDAPDYETLLKIEKDGKYLIVGCDGRLTGELDPQTAAKVLHLCLPR